jgi:pyrroloquinoline quinone (PQQ) biosynthesis protein C
MGIVAIDSSWHDLLPSEWLRQLSESPFLTRCREQRASRRELHGFVRQQGHYSRHFTRFLTALMSNLEDDGDRRALMQNLWEEMGLGGGHATPHSQIYRNMMATMGIDLDEEAPGRATTGLIETMFDCCRSPNPMVGLGAICLGAEAIVPYIYSTVIEGFKGIGEPVEHLEFFSIHVSCDDEHAITMRSIIMRKLKADRRSRIDLDYGAAKALAARVAFFNAIAGAISHEPHAAA